MRGYTPEEKRGHVERFRTHDPEHRAFLHERIRELRFQGEESEFFFEQLPLIFLAVVALLAPAIFYLHEKFVNQPFYREHGLQIIAAALAIVIVAYAAAHVILRKKDEEIRERVQANYDLLLGRK
jgi:branched-subunit amino acid ABC-type transport system permease component